MHHSEASAVISQVVRTSSRHGALMSNRHPCFVVRTGIRRLFGIPTHCIDQVVHTPQQLGLFRYVPFLTPTAVFTKGIRNGSYLTIRNPITGYKYCGIAWGYPVYCE